MVAKRKVETSLGSAFPETRIPNRLTPGWPFRESLSCNWAPTMDDPFIESSCALCSCRYAGRYCASIRRTKVSSRCRTIEHRVSTRECHTTTTSRWTAQLLRQIPQKRRRVTHSEVHLMEGLFGVWINCRKHVMKRPLLLAKKRSSRDSMPYPSFCRTTNYCKPSKAQSLRLPQATWLVRPVAMASSYMTRYFLFPTYSQSN